MNLVKRLGFLGLILLPLTGFAVETSAKYFTITVVDDQTGRGVPLVELRTVHNVSYFTDSNGVVAFREPGLMNQKVFFFVQSHGYEFPNDGFGFRGRALLVKEGGSARLKIKRINIAERLYRITGAGIYSESIRAGRPVPIQKPALNGKVFGSDSVVNAIYRGKIYWFWGDTLKPDYPLGNFHVPGATSILPNQGGLDPEVGIDLDYFLADSGFAKETARPPGNGPTWITGLVSLKDKNGKERMFATYQKVQGSLTIYEQGLVEFQDKNKRFEPVCQFPRNAPIQLHGHTFLKKENNEPLVYYANPFPLVRVRANPKDLQNPERFEAFTCLQEGSRLENPKFERIGGQLHYGWKKNTPPVSPEEQAKFIKAGLLKGEECLLHLQDVNTGKSVIAHRGSVNWNPYRRRWVLITVELGGTSMLGEIWYAEADTPLGPWVYARKILTHNRYSFYNPKHHPQFDKGMGRFIFFEGTYTKMFSGNTVPTPRYEYNQILYKLDLADPKLGLPVSIYQREDQHFSNRENISSKQKTTIPFFALDRPAKGSIPVCEITEGKHSRLRVGSLPAPAQGKIVFHALPAHGDPLAKITVPLYEFENKDGRRVYTVDSSWSSPGFQKADQPLCRVWRNPMRLQLPVR